MSSDRSNSLKESLDKIIQLGEMKQKGLLTDDEFEKLKELLISTMENRNPRILKSISTLTANFVTYQNMTYGIKICYPSDWEGTELNRSSDSTTDIVEFGLPLEDPSNSYGRYIGVILINVRKLYTRNIPIRTFSAGETFRLKKMLKDFKIIESFVSKIARMPAYKIVFSYSQDGIPFRIVNMRVWITTADKVYCIIYHTRLDWFNEILSIVNKIIDSFELIQGSYKPMEQQEIRDFLVYDNPILGIKTKYPVDWIIDERYDNSYTNKEFSKCIAFMSRSDKDRNSFEDVIIVEIKDLQSHDTLIDTYVHHHIDNLMKKTPKNSNLMLIETIPVHISGNSGKKVVYKTVSTSGDEIKVMEFLFIKNNKAYSIIYAMEVSKFDKHLSTIGQMVNSLEIAK